MHHMQTPQLASLHVVGCSKGKSLTHIFYFSDHHLTKQTLQWDKEQENNVKIES